MKPVQIYPLFSIPLMVTNVDVDERVATRLKSYDYVQMIDQYGEFTVNKKILNEPEFIDLKQQLKGAATDALHIAGIDKTIGFKVTGSWVVKQTPNTNPGIVHMHENSAYSAVWYFDVDEQTSPLRFYNDIPINKVCGMNLPISEPKNMFSSDIFDFKPKKSNLIIFPSTLDHQVLVNRSNITRYSLAFNLFPTGRWGDGVAEIEFDMQD